MNTRTVILIIAAVLAIELVTGSALLLGYTAAIGSLLLFGWLIVRRALRRRSRRDAGLVSMGRVDIDREAA